MLHGVGAGEISHISKFQKNRPGNGEISSKFRIFNMSILKITGLIFKNITVNFAVKAKFANALSASGGGKLLASLIMLGLKHRLATGHENKDRSTRVCSSMCSRGSHFSCILDLLANEPRHRKPKKWGPSNQSFVILV